MPTVVPLLLLPEPGRVVAPRPVTLPVLGFEEPEMPTVEGRLWSVRPTCGVVVLLRPLPILLPVLGRVVALRPVILPVLGFEEPEVPTVEGRLWSVRPTCGVLEVLRLTCDVLEELRLTCGVEVLRLLLVALLGRLTCGVLEALRLPLVALPTRLTDGAVDLLELETAADWLLLAVLPPCERLRPWAEASDAPKIRHPMRAKLIIIFLTEVFIVLLFYIVQQVI